MTKKRYIVFIIALSIGFMIYTINVDGIDNILNVLTSANYTWMGLGLLCLLAEYIFESIAINIPLKKMYKGHKFWTSFKSNAIGRLFNNVTPFSSGGQPIQVYYLKSYDIRTSDSLSVLMMRFVVYQLAVFSWAIILMAVNFSFFNQTFGNYMGLVLLGFFLNLIAMLFIFIAGINRNLILKIATPIIRFIAKIKIGKIKIIKDVDKTVTRFEEGTLNYNLQFRQMKKEKTMILKIYIFSMLQLLAYFSIPFMVYKAFGNMGTSYIQILMVQCYLLLVMSFIPTPGSGLGAEGGFALFYNRIFSNGLNMGILFWRLYTFYMPIIIGSIFVAFQNKKNTKTEKA